MPTDVGGDDMTADIDRLAEVDAVVGGDDKCLDAAVFFLFVALYFFIPHSSKCILYALTLCVVRIVILIVVFSQQKAKCVYLRSIEPMLLS